MTVAASVAQSRDEQNMRRILPCDTSRPVGQMRESQSADLSSNHRLIRHQTTN
jgi:hypothetical protein